MSHVHEGYRTDMQCQQNNQEWHTSSWSMNGGHCVQAASARQHIIIRDSKAAAGPLLQVSAGAWRLFVKQIKGDQ